MSLPAPYSEVYLEGDGVTTEFAFGTNFKPISAGLVKCIVYLEDGYEVVPTYTVNMAVGSITISALTMPDTTVLTAPPLGSTVRIFRDEPEAQPVSASQIQSYTSKQLEILFDAIVAMIQEVSYTTDHKTVRLTEPQRDIALQELGALEDEHLIYWDNAERKLVVTNYPQKDVVRCANGLFFRLRTDPDTQEPYLQWSTDESDWHSINIDEVELQAQGAYALAGDAYTLAYATRGELNTHKGDHSNPHETSLANLIDTNVAGATGGQFLQYNGINWVPVSSTATVSWGGILGNIDDQTDLQDKLYTKFDKTGGAVLGEIDIRRNSSTSSALLTMTNNTANTARIWRFAPSYSTVSLSVYPGSTETNGYRFVSTGFCPASNNARYLGAASLKWKGVYTGALNNGADLVVPNKAGTLATMDDVELAARSGTQLTDQGVWYAKMYAATVAPAAENGTNYADFSQVDGQGNPIIVTYNRVNGAWVQDQTITPPAEYDGYVIVTSKIWDIAEQTGQQGGRVLWNHTSKEFTPYPQIISFENIEVTGDSTVDMPQNPGANQIVNKGYVDEAIAEIPTGGSGLNVGDVFFTMRNDNELNGAVECDGATYNTTDFTGAQSIGALLEAGKIDYVSLSAYSTAISTKGWCDKIGWDGAGNTAFRVPTLNAHIVQTNNIPVVGNGSTTNLYNTAGATSDHRVALTASGLLYLENVAGSQLGFTTDPTKSGIIADTSDTAQLRVMIQLATGATDTALETCTGVLADVAELKYDYVVDFQAPTAANNYTWYRKYKSGWVEQGGSIDSAASGTYTVTFPITMADTHYTALKTMSTTSSSGAQYNQISFFNKTTTSAETNTAGVGFSWQVSGMAQG